MPLGSAGEIIDLFAGRGLQQSGLDLNHYDRAAVWGDCDQIKLAARDRCVAFEDGVSQSFEVLRRRPFAQPPGAVLGI